MKPQTRINVAGRVRKHLVPFFGSRGVGTIQPVHVRALVAHLSGQGLAPSTTKAVLLTLGQIMRVAEVDGLIRRSPCIGIELPAEIERPEMRFLTEAQVRALAKAIHPRFKVAIYVAAYSGLRSGEMWVLTTDRVNLLKPSIRVIESLAEVNGRLTTGTTKTNKPRVVNIPRFLADMLAEQLREYPSEDGYVFTSPGGGPVRHHNFTQRHFKAAVRSAGLDGLRWHDLRHTAAAILISRGWSMEQVKRHLGHRSIRVTSDTYSHLFEGHDDVLLDRLDQGYRDTASTPFVASAWPEATISALHPGGESTGNTG